MEAAINNLALMHIFGIGVPEKDLLKARQLLQQAAEKKDPEAMLNLATAYKKGVFGNVDEKEINRLYENAAKIYEVDIKAGKTKAMRNLALMYHFGVGKTVDNNKAVELLEKAVAKGYAPAMQTLGFLHHFNICKNADRNKAEQLYRNAAKLGDLLAMNNLAVLLKQKNGEKFTEEGKKLLDEAAEKGHPGAAFTRASAYKEDGDFKSALAMSELAYRQGSAAAAQFIGNLYEEGKGVEKDEVKALQLYLFASQWGYNAVSGDLSRLATKLGNQEYEAKHYEQALGLYVTACSNGNKNVANRLGYMFENDQGHKLDKKEALGTAIHFYSIATDEKDKEGSQNYHRLAKQLGYPIKRPLTFWEKFGLAVTIVGGAAAFVGGFAIGAATLGTATPLAAFFITVGTSTLTSAGTAALAYGAGQAWNGQPVDIKALGKEVGYGAAFGLVVGVVAGGFVYVKAVKALADAANVAAEGGKIAATEGTKLAAAEGTKLATTEAAKEVGKTFGQHALSFTKAAGIGAATYTGARAVERHSEGKVSQHYGSFGKATKTILTDIAIGAAIGLVTKGLHVGAKKGAGFVSDKLLERLSKNSMPERVLGNNFTTSAGKVASKSMASTIGDCASDGLNALTTGDSDKFINKWQNLGNAAQIMATAVASKSAGKALGHMASETSDHALTKGDATKNPLGWKGKVAKGAVNGAVEGTTETVVRNIIKNRKFEGQTSGVTPAGIAGAAANGGFVAFAKGNGNAPKTENNSQNVANNGKGESMAK